MGLFFTPGASFTFRVSVRDEAGNVSVAAAAPTFQNVVHQENSTSIVYSSGWLTRLAQSSAFGGFVKPTTTPGATATINFTSTRNAGVVMSLRTDLGKAKICLIDGAAETCGVRDFSMLGTQARTIVIGFNGLETAKTYSDRVER